MVTRSRPKQVRIGGIMYPIRRRRHLKNEDGDGREVMGLFDSPNGQILLKSHQSYDQERQCLWHELMHGIFETAGQPEAVPDSVIDLIAHGVVQVLRDNPELRGGYERQDIPLGSGQGV